MAKTERPGFGVPDAAALLLIMLIWAVMSVLINPVGGFPLNDDWIYGGAVKSMLSGEGFRIPGAVRGTTIANLFAQASWGALFTLPAGFSYTALRLSTLVLAALGLGFSLHCCGRQAFAALWRSRSR